jgi:hypothetical protein
MMNEMFSPRRKYEFRLRNGFLYTGVVLSSGKDYIRVRTIKDELVILRIKDISIAKVLGGNNNE